MTSNNLDDKCITLLTNALSNNKTLSTLSLGSNRSVTIAGWQHFVRWLQTSNASVEKIDLGNNRLSDELVGALANNTKLQALGIKDLLLYPPRQRTPTSFSRLVTPTGWQNFFVRLQNSGSVLEELNLYCDKIDDSVVPAMVDALASISTLTELDLSNQSISAQGWCTFFSLLPNSSLRSLSLSENHFTDAPVRAFANALVRNSTLETIDLAFNGITKSGWEALANVLCDKSSISHLFSSNHALQEVKVSSRTARQSRSFRTFNNAGLTDDLLASLQLNTNSNKFEVARQKILQHWFTNGNANIEGFADMEWKVMPRTIAWAGRDDTGLSLLFRIILSMPSLLDVADKREPSGVRR